MRLAEINVLGILVAPIVPLLLAAWALTAAIRVLADRFGLMTHVWHPTLAVVAVYATVLAALVLLAAGAMV